MVSREVVVNNASGLHARPATLVVKEASRFKSNVNIEYNGRKGNAKSIIAVLALGIHKGSAVKVVVDGDDEAQAADALVKLIETMEE